MIFLPHISSRFKCCGTLLIFIIICWCKILIAQEHGIEPSKNDAKLYVFNQDDWDELSISNIGGYLDQKLSWEKRYWHLEGLLDSIKTPNKYLSIDSVISSIKSEIPTDSFLIRKANALYGWYLDSRGFKKPGLEAYLTAHRHASNLSEHNNIFDIEVKLAILYNQLGNHLQSQYYYNTALSAYNEKLKHPLDAKQKLRTTYNLNRAQNNYGWLLFWKGQTDQAIDILTKSYYSAKNNKTVHVQFFAGYYLARIYEHINHLDSTRFYLNEIAYEKLKYHPKRNMSAAASAMVMRGISAKGAEKRNNYFQAALDSIRIWGLDDEPREYAKILYRMAACYFDQSEWELGGIQLKKGLKLLNLPGKLHQINTSHLYEENTIAQFLSLYADYYEYQFSLTQKNEFADSALVAIEHAKYVYDLLNIDFQTTDDKLILIEPNRALTNQAIDILYTELKNDPTTFDKWDLVNHYFNQSKNNILAESVERQQHLTSLPEATQTEIKALKSAIAANTSNLNQVQNPRKSDSIFNYIFLQRQQLQNLVGTSDHATNHTLPSHAIDYIVTEKDVYVRYYDAETIVFNRVGSTTTIDSMLAAATKGILQQDTSYSFYKNQYNIYRLVVEPYLPPSKEVIIIPDGPLQLCSFGALVTNPAKKKFLIEEVNLGIGYNLEQKSKGKKTNYGDMPISAIMPEYEAPSTLAMAERGGYYKLLFTEEEINGIQQAWTSDVDVISGNNKSTILSVLNTAGIFHFAGHATAVGRKNGLVLGSDGHEIISDREIMEYPSSKSLAVLSACETGLGKVVKGDGVRSLARSFLESGVDQVVYTLWPINDQTSATIISDFYRTLRETSSPQRALNEAQRGYLRKVNGLLSHPYYWAAFQATASERRRDRSRLRGSHLVALLILFSVLLFLNFKIKS